VQTGLARHLQPGVIGIEQEEFMRARRLPEIVDLHRIAVGAHECSETVGPGANHSGKILPQRIDRLDHGTDPRPQSIERTGHATAGQSGRQSQLPAQLGHRRSRNQDRWQDRRQNQKRRVSPRHGLVPG
jgi:hypothetical protein